MEITLAAFPMHGQKKLATEGYRTRDGHLIEWFGELLKTRGSVEVVSRPDPILLSGRYPSQNIASNTRPVDSSSFALPNPLNKKKWWVTSSRHYPFGRLSRPDAIVAWNPFVFQARGFPQYSSAVPVAIDLLDDWTVHQAFEKISGAVHAAYQVAFDRADLVYANSEGTESLARRYGRDDVILIPNGTDAKRFSTVSRASGPLTIGYIGKIGSRVDLDLIRDVAIAFPSWKIVLAGPVIERSYTDPLKRFPNIELLGDIPYPYIPELLQSFDIGWVPHSVGKGEVGGDAIKIYEYNAAGLPVLSTPIIGAGKRGIEDVHVLKASEHISFLQTRYARSTRVNRVSPSLPPSAAWEGKARTFLNDLGL